MIITGKKFSKPEMSRVKNGDVILRSEEKPAEKTRLDLLLVEKYPEYNRSTLQNFIRSGYVTVNSEVIRKPNWAIENTISSDIRSHGVPLAASEATDRRSAPATAGGAERIGRNSVSIVLHVPEKQETKNLPTIYEDQSVLVVNKPTGLLSMAKGEFTEESTLEDYGLLVHRLDRDTSGVVILAKNEETQKLLRNQFQQRETHKTYYAIVEGKPKLSEAIIDLPLARNLKKPTTFMVDPKGKPAQTQYKVLKSTKNLSLLELKPVTGRTHQLRVHLRYIGCPILGDKVYGTGKKADRLFLHAAALEISIPGETGNIRKIFEAPLPDVFETALAKDKN